MKRWRIVIILFLYAFFFRWISTVSLPGKDPGMMVFVPASASLVMLLYGIYWMRKEEQEEEFLLIFGSLWSLSLAWIFRWAPMAMGGGVGDSWITHAMVAKFRHFWSNVDYTFYGLHSFYPFYYQYFIGKLAWALGVEGYRVLKFFPIAFSFLLPLLIYLGLKTFLSRFQAMGASVLIVFFTGLLFVYKPYEFLPLAFIIPWWVYFVEKGKGNPAVGGALGGLMVATYYYWFFPFLLYSLWKITERGRAKRILESWKKVLAFLFSFALFSLPYWGGYLWDLLKRGGDFLQHSNFRWGYTKFVPMNTGVVKGGDLLWGVSFLGIIYMLWSYKRKEESRFLLILLVISYFLYLLGQIGTLLFNPILQYKLNYFLVFIVVIGFCLGLQQVSSEREFLHRAGALFFIFVAMAAIFNTSSLRRGRFFKDAMKQKPLEVREDEKPLFGKTVLGLPPRVLNFMPSYLFLYNGARSAHPSGLVQERLAFLYLLQHYVHPKFFLYMLRHNRFSPVDFIYLKERTEKFCIKRYFLEYPNIYRSRPYGFCFRLPRRLLLEPPAVKDIYRKGDMVIPVKEVKEPGAMFPLEEFILNEFSGEGIRPAPKWRLSPVEVYELGRWLLFYSRRCKPYLTFSLKDAFFSLISPAAVNERLGQRESELSFRIRFICHKRIQKSETYSLKKSGVIGRICVGLVRIPLGCAVESVEREKGEK